jgi:hypothetical protein
MYFALAQFIMTSAGVQTAPQAMGASTIAIIMSGRRFHSSASIPSL